MDDFPVSSARGAERPRDAADPKRDPLKMLLDVTLRLHAALDRDRLEPLGQACAESAREYFGSGQGFVLVRRGPGDLRLPLNSKRVELQTGPLPPVLQRALHSAAPVVEGVGQGRSVAVALRAKGRVVGGIYLAAGEAERRFGPAFLELLQVFAQHLAVAIENLLYLQDAISLAEGVEYDRTLTGLHLSEVKQAFEKRLLQTRLREAHGNIAEAARSLCMDRGQLSRLLRKHEIDRGAYREEIFDRRAGAT